MLLLTLIRSGSAARWVRKGKRSNADPMHKILILIICILSAPDINAQNVKHFFKPVVFHNSFSTKPESVLKIKPGDTVQTETIDAMGYDKEGIRRGHGSNP